VSTSLRILRTPLGSIGHRGRTAPKFVPQPARRVPQVSVAPDIIAIEDATRLVAAQCHRDALKMKEAAQSTLM
jgi:hypothetical protein